MKKIPYMDINQFECLFPVPVFFKTKLPRHHYQCQNNLIHCCFEMLPFNPAVPHLNSIPIQQLERQARSDLFVRYKYPAVKTYY